MKQKSKEPAPLVKYLYGLAESRDRATLAELRASLREGRQLDALRIVLPMLGSAVGNRWAEDDAVLLAGLFALHPVAGGSSLARALRGVWKDTGSDSVEARFRALMGASREDVPVHVRHAISLVASGGRGVDWQNLYDTIRYWNGTGGGRRRWARDFWAPVGAEVDEEEGATTPATTNEYSNI